MPKVWFWTPNSLSETLEFNTQILTSRTSENRTSHMDAVQRLRFGYTASPDEAEKMINLYLSDPNQIFHVPEWPTATLSRTASVSSADTTIPVEDDVVYQVGQSVIFGVGDHWELGEISSLGGTSVNLVSAASRDYAGSQEQPFFVAPLINCILPSGVEYSSRYPIRGMNVEFLSVQPIDIQESTYATFAGLPLVTDGQVGISEYAGSASRSSMLVSSGFGSFEIIETETFTRRTGTMSFFDLNYADRMMRRRFFHFMRGRDGELWAPSGQADVIIASGFGPSEILIDIQPVAPAADMVGRFILITEGANSAAREILGALDNSETSQTIQIAATGFSATNAANVSFLTKCRFDTDAIEISYFFSKDGLMAQTSLSIIEVP